jgi:hypothetical protein
MLDYITHIYDPQKNYVVVGGDFNYLMDRKIDDHPDWLPPFPNDLYDSEFLPVFDSKKTTMRSSEGKEYTIDGFIVSKNVKVIDCKTLDYRFEFSNHNPVTLKFKI